MAAAGGASSIITQVQQGGPPINTIGGELGDTNGWFWIRANDAIRCWR